MSTILTASSTTRKQQGMVEQVNQTRFWHPSFIVGSIFSMPSIHTPSPMKKRPKLLDKISWITTLCCSDYPKDISLLLNEEKVPKLVWAARLILDTFGQKLTECDLEKPLCSFR